MWKMLLGPHHNLAPREESFKIGASCSRWRRVSRKSPDEIEKIQNERPNDPETVTRNRKLSELSNFAEGFRRIATAINALSAAPQEERLLTRASAAVRGVAHDLELWLGENRAEAVDWVIRIPVFGAGVAMLNLAGANMTVATAALATLVGGAEVAEVTRGKKELNKAANATEVEELDKPRRTGAEWHGAHRSAG